MSCSDSNTTSDNTKIEIPLAPETERLVRAQENIPVACEESVHQNRLPQNRRDSAVSIIRTAGVLSIGAIVLITTVVAVCTGDTSKLAAAAVALNNVAQALALNSNGTSASQESGF